MIARRLFTLSASDGRVRRSWRGAKQLNRPVGAGNSVVPVDLVVRVHSVVVIWALQGSSAWPVSTDLSAS